MPAACCVRGCRSKSNGIIKFFRFPRDITRRLQWTQALDRENFVPNNNTLICEAHFTTNDYQRRPDLIKLTHTAVPSIFKVPNNDDKQNASSKKVVVPKLKPSQVRKRNGSLSDHTYARALLEEIIPEDIGFQKSISPSKCVAYTSNAGESLMLNLSQSNIQTSRNIENPIFKIPESSKIIFQPPEQNWENIAMTQGKTIHHLRKRVKVLHQKIRRYSVTIEKLKKQWGIIISFQ